MDCPLARAVLTTLGLCGACLLSDAAFAQQPTDIGTLPGFTIARPRNISNHGTIVGQAERAPVEPTQQAALWTRTDQGYAVEALPALAGLLRSDARAFARDGAPVGSSSLIGTFSQVRAVVWQKDPSGQRVPVDLEPPAGFTDAQAFDANHNGLIVGEAFNPGEVINGSIVRHAVAWTPKGRGGYEVEDLGVPEGFDVSSASGVNDLGEIVGTARRFETDDLGVLFQRAVVVVWHARSHRHRRCRADTAVILPSHPDLPHAQSPTISTAGVIVAQADVPTAKPLVSRALVWVRWGHGFAGPYKLPVPKGFTDAGANDVNEPGLILGTAYVRQAATTPETVASQAVVWAWSWAKRRFVSRLLPSPPDTVYVTGARINQRGDAVGNAPIPPAGTSGGLLWKRASCGRWFGPRWLREPQLEAP
jgi:uncharacterized membrane protein